jgi:hypothetical protein
MSTPLVDSIIAETPPADLLRSVAARMRELADATTQPAVARAVAAWLDDVVECEETNSGCASETRSAMEIARAFMDATGWRG